MNVNTSEYAGISKYVRVRVCVYIITLYLKKLEYIFTYPSARQDMTQAQFLNGV